MAEGATAGAPAGFVAPGVALTPLPDWVDAPALAIPVQADERFVVAGLCVLLDDSQVSLAGGAPAHFLRRAEMVVAASGASNAARFQVEFDPAYERLDIHYIRIHRAGQTLTRGDPGDFEVMRRERNLEMRHFDGRLTVYLEIPDVRVGDVVETAWTVHGEREIVAGRYAGWARFEWSPVGMVETCYRLLTPETRVIATKAYGGAAPTPTETSRDGLVDRRWRAREREGVKTEPLALPWIHQLATIQLSEWRDWAEVAARFAPVYEEAGPLPMELEAQVAEYAKLATPKERAAAVLRFVQHSVRYLAISMGEGGLVPRPVAEIWETRYGDCKDVTKLFVLLARRLGLDACPALVNTNVGEGLKDLLPTASLFDHCLIRLSLDGKGYWLDATLATQPSPLDALFQPRFGWALPLAPGVTALEHMGQEPFLTLCESREKVELPERASMPIVYEWAVTSRGWRAEHVRAQLASDGEVGYFRAREQNIQSVWPSAKLASKTVADDPVANAITVTSRYEVPDGWKDADGDRKAFMTLDTVLANYLAPLDPGPVKHPIYMGRVGRVVRRVEIAAARAVGADDWDKMTTHDVASVSFTHRRLNMKNYVLEEALNIRKIAMPPESAERYREIANEVRATDITFVATLKRDKFVKMKQGGGGFDVPWWLIWLAIVGIGAISRGLGN